MTPESGARRPVRIWLNTTCSSQQGQGIGESSSQPRTSLWQIELFEDGYSRYDRVLEEALRAPFHGFIVVATQISAVIADKSKRGERIATGQVHSAVCNRDHDTAAFAWRGRKWQWHDHRPCKSHFTTDTFICDSHCLLSSPDAQSHNALSGCRDCRTSWRPASTNSPGTRNDDASQTGGRIYSTCYVSQPDHPL
jgi:hypothetical protein